jgi:glyoxylase-like metal-dependent hydrolase (beta-lactamase superfamily II)
LNPRDWYAIDVMGDGVTRIAERHALPLHGGQAWLVRGRDRDVLIDACTGIVPLKPLVQDLSGREPVLVVTHAHYDHMGGAHEFGARFAHPAEVAAMVLGGRAATLAEGWLGAGSFRRAPWPGFDPAAHEIRPAPPTGLLSDGDTIDLGDRSLRVIHLPGHAPGLIGVFDEAMGLLFSSDALYDGPMVLDVPGSDRAAFALSLRCIRELPLERVHPGHFESFDAARAHAIIDRRLAGAVRLEGGGETV